MKTNRANGKRKGTLDYFDGPTLNDALDAITSNFLLLEKSIDDIQVLSMVPQTLEACLSFTRKFYTTVDNLKVKDIISFTDGCKQRSADLVQMKDNLVNETGVVTIGVFPKGKPGVLAENIKYYSKSDIIGFDHEFDQVEGILFTNTVNPKIYSPLFREGIKLFQNYYNSGEPGSMNDFLTLYNLLITVSKIYCEFNTPDAEKEKFALSMKNTLEESHDSWFDQEVNQALEETLDDLMSGQKPYVRELFLAITSNREFTKSKFSIQDYYVSLKASAAVSDYLESQSLLKSTWETDPLNVPEFDEFSGYISKYNKEAPKNYKNVIIKTIVINNPSKVGPRVIHIACNSVQDRCFYIQRRLAKILSSLESDCTKDQQKGVNFIRKITSEKYRIEHGYPSMFNADFTSATDTLDPKFQELCLSLIFDKPIVDFWHTVSSMEKVFIINGKEFPYKQVSGQPQGILGSFDAFALAHHVIFLTSMKMAGLEEVKASDCYVVLGDDSAATSVKYGIDLLSIYTRVVKNFSLKFNLSKAGVVRQGQGEVARLDFAKQTVLDGEFDTPIPARIFFRATSKEEGHYYQVSVITWLQAHKRNMNKSFNHVLDTRYKDDPESREIAEKILRGGFSPLFKDFKSTEIVERVSTNLLIAYAVGKVKSTFVEACLSDKVKESLNLQKGTVDDALLRLLPKKRGKELLNKDGTSYFDLAHDPNHKFYEVINKNMVIEESLRTITGIDDIDWSLAAASLYLDESEHKSLSVIASAINNLGYFDNEGEDHKDQIREALKGLDKLSRFEMRSVSKRTAKLTNMFDTIISDFNSITALTV